MFRIHTALPIRPKMGLPLQASKWLSCPLLVDQNEMKDLMNSLGDFWIFLVQGVHKKNEGSISKEAFLDSYTTYIEGLKRGEVVETQLVKSCFSSVWTRQVEALYSIPVREDQQIIKVDRPVLQLQTHRFTYSSSDGKFRSMTFGPNAVHWGIQFSYPQLYQDSAYRILSVKDTPEFPNTILYKNLQRWVREFTLPTPFVIDGKQVNVPIRLGKNCFTWINNHPHLLANQLTIKT